MPSTMKSLFNALALDDDTAAVLRAIAAENDTAPTGTDIDLAHGLLARLGPGRSGWESPRIQRARRALTGWLDGASPDPAVGPALLRSERTVALTFAGQGGPWLDELVELATTSEGAAHLIAVSLRSLQSCYDGLTEADRTAYGSGLDVAEWIRTPESRPSAAYLASAPVSFPLIFITQAARLVQLLEQGMDRPAFRDRVAAAAGHSQGIAAAIFASETWRRPDPARRAADYVRILFFLGLRLQQVGTLAAPTPTTLARSREDGHEPTPMAAVSGLDSRTLDAVIGRLGLPITRALANTRRRHGVSGAPEHLEALRLELEAAGAATRKAHAAGQHFGRVAAAQWAYLPVSAPFHSPLVADAARQARLDLSDLTISASDLAFPVLDGSTSRPLTGDDLVGRILDLVACEQGQWVSNVDALRARGIGCLLDLGPDEGVMRLSSSTLKGWDVAALALSRADHRQALLDPNTAPEPRITPFETHRPQRTADGSLTNRFTRWTGMPPVFLPGMTPTTVEAPIVAAAANAGFMAELAGGGQVTEAILRARLGELRERLTPGRGIVFNALYLDPYLWRLHFGGERPLVVRLRDEGHPILGVTVTAGIPPTDEAVELLRTLVAHGLWLNSLKPGTHSQIRQVLAIADAAPELTLLVQVEGGKAGGHHSWEDLSDLLETWYAELRSRDNIVLAVGGGVGREERATALLDGTWSRSAGLPDMPVDAVFIGTACMAALEAETAPAVKQAMADAPGTEQVVLDGQSLGGITSGKSGLDAAIHYLDNSAAAVGRLLDSVAGDPDVVAARRDELIEALNRTAKPYFGTVEEMTWTTLLQRYVSLCAI
ncbi:MAG: fatty acid synthase, partial [Myxococcota bacterium]